MLDAEIKIAAEAFFGVELGDVEIHVGALPAALNAVACAYGNHVFLDEEPALPLSPRSLEILGHELTHVMQQRQGRVPANLMIGGLPANQDPALEWEAEEMGRRFACGGWSILPSLARAAPCPPVMQRILKVGRSNYTGLTNLSPKSQLIVQLIKNGQDWLTWISGSSTASYQFADESQLLAGIQSGLHGTPLMLLQQSKILVHPARLAELNEEELKALLAVESASEENSVAEKNSQKALAANSLWSQTDLAIGASFLSENGVASQPVFQAMTLADEVALFDLVNGASTQLSLNAMIQKEAAAFSVIYAQTPMEFVDYYQFYISTVQDPNPQADQAGKRSRAAEAAADALEPLLYSLLWCPLVAGVPSLNDVTSIVQGWAARGNRMGFGRLSTALSQINENAQLQGATGTAAQQIIQQYMAQVQNALVQQTPAAIRLSQDGMEHYYEYPSSSAAAELRLAADGTLTLSKVRAQK